MRQALGCAIAISIIAIGHGNASAGRTFYGWLYGTEVMPERSVELQTWVVEKNELGDAKIRESSVWWGPLIGVTDRLELAIPIEFLWRSAIDTETTFTLQRFGIEARYRFVTQDPEERPPFAPLLRVAAKRDVVIRDRLQLEADFVVSYENGRIHALVDAGVAALITPDETVFEVRPGAGISVEVLDDLRIGAELFGEINSSEALEQERWAGVGPNFAWTHGRFWLSGALLVGVYNIKVAPRFMFGVAF